MASSDDDVEPISPRSVNGKYESISWRYRIIQVISKVRYRITVPQSNRQASLAKTSRSFSESHFTGSTKTIRNSSTTLDTRLGMYCCHRNPATVDISKEYVLRDFWLQLVRKPITAWKVSWRVASVLTENS